MNVALASGGSRGGFPGVHGTPLLTYLLVYKVWVYFAHVYVRYGNGPPFSKSWIRPCLLKIKDFLYCQLGIGKTDFASRNESASDVDQISPVLNAHHW